MTKISSFCVTWKPLIRESTLANRQVKLLPHPRAPAPVRMANRSRSSSPRKSSVRSFSLDPHFAPFKSRSITPRLARRATWERINLNNAPIQHRNDPFKDKRASSADAPQSNRRQQFSGRFENAEFSLGTHRSKSSNWRRILPANMFPPESSRG